MSFLYNAAPVDFISDNEIDNLDKSEIVTNPNSVFRKKLNKTYKKQNRENDEKTDNNNSENSKRVERVMNAIHNRKNHNQSLGDFPRTESAKMVNNDLYDEVNKYQEYKSEILNNKDTSLIKKTKNNTENSDDNDVNIEGYNNIKDNNNNDYYSNYLPYYSNVSNNNKLMNENEIYKKLDYLIHLVEEIKDEKTNNVTEELILYSFLGVFIIFIVDSFSKSGKYNR